MLATHPDDLAGLNMLERFDDPGHQWAQVIDVVARRYHNHHANPKAAQVLLVLEALVHGQQNLEQPVSRPKQRPVPDACPSGLPDRTDFMPGEFLSQALRNTLIEQ